MNYFQLVAGIVVTLTFLWFFFNSIKRYGITKTLLAIDIIMGLFAGVYLLATSISQY